MGHYQDMTEISIHTPGGEAHLQNINSPLNLKFVDIDDSSDESIKEEEEAHDHSETFVDDERLVGEDSDEPVSIAKLRPNTLVEVALSRIWFPARVLAVEHEEDYCVVVILNSF